MKRETHGIVTMAIGDPIYGRYAFNLALSVKALDPLFSISIIADDLGLAHLKQSDRSFFHKIIDPSTVTDSRNPFYLKLSLEQLSPYDQTLFLDADTILTAYAQPKQIFDKLNGVLFTVACRGQVSGGTSSGHSEWVNLNDVREVYGFDNWYDLSSEFIYFEKGEQATMLFDFARDYYNSPLLKVREFAGTLPDEPALTLAMLKMGIAPHVIPFLPSWWEAMFINSKERTLKPIEVFNKYWLVSAGGKRLNKRNEQIYNQLAGIHSQAFGLTAWKAQHKDKHLRERKLI